MSILLRDPGNGSGTAPSDPRLANATGMDLTSLFPQTAWMRQPKGGMFGSRLYRPNAQQQAIADGVSHIINAGFCDAPLPGGGTIRENVRGIHAAMDMMSHSAEIVRGDPGQPGRDMLAYWLSNVAPGGRWAGRLGEPAGNRNYGATGRALGLPLETLLRGAGAAEALEAVTGRTGSATKGVGSPLRGPPYGDTEAGQKQIKEGYYARCD